MASLDSNTQTLTAKNLFLNNPELIAMTFSHLQEELELKYDEKCRCFFNIALTCKDFLDLAIDALWETMYSWEPLLKLLPALQIEDDAYVLSGNVSQADWNRLEYYSRRVKLISIKPDDREIHPSTYIRIAQLQSSVLFPSLRRLCCNMSKSSHIFLFLSPLLDSLELYNIRGFENTIVGPFLATLSGSPQMLSRIVLRKGRMSADILKKSIIHFRQLRSLNLFVEVFMSDFTLWEVLGTLPSLADLALTAKDPASHPADAPENSHSPSGSPTYFDALEKLCVTGSFFFIRHLLDFIDSPYLKSIEVYPVIDNVSNEDDHGPYNLFTTSMTIVASKWSQTLKNFVINGTYSGHTYSGIAYLIPKSFSLLTDLHEMQNFTLHGWNMENMDDGVRRMVMSWPKLRHLDLGDSQTFISLSTLRIIAENCPNLRWLFIRLDTSSIPPFDTSSKSLGHKLEALIVGRPTSQTSESLECQIHIARILDLIFPNLNLSCIPPDDVTWSGIRDLVKLCQDIRRGQSTVA